MAKTLIMQMINNRFERELILFDRGYPSTELIAFRIDNRIDFLIRRPKRFSKAVRNAKKADQVIDIIHEGQSYRVRVVRFMLDSGEEEILQFDNNLTIEDFKELYFKRWGIETKFNELKNRIEIENFTG